MILNKIFYLALFILNFQPLIHFKISLIEFCRPSKHTVGSKINSDFVYLVIIKT